MANDINIKVNLQGAAAVTQQIDNITGAISGMGMIWVASKISAPLKAFGTAALNMAGQLQQAEIGFTTLLKSGEKAKQFLNELKDFAAETPFEFVGLQKTALRMTALGFETKQVIPVLRVLGDTVGAMGGSQEQLDRIIYNLGQMKMIGKVTGHEMRDLAMAGVKAWDYLAAAVGKSVPEAMDMATKGAIDAKTGLVAVFMGMQKDFGGGMEKQMGTLTQGFSNFKDEMNFIMGEIGKTLNETFGIQTIVVSITSALHKLRIGWDEIPGPIKSVVAVIGGLLAILPPLALSLGGIGAILPTIVGGFGNLGVTAATFSTALAALSSPIGLIIISLTAIGVVLYVLINHWDEMAYHAQVSLMKIKIVVFNTTADILEGMSSLEHVWDKIFESWRKSFKWGAELGEHIRDAFKKGWVEGIAEFFKLGDRMGEAIRSGEGPVTQAAKTLREAANEELGKVTVLQFSKQFQKDTAQLNEQFGLLVQTMQKHKIDVADLIEKYRAAGGDVTDFAATFEYLKSMAGDDFLKLFGSSAGNAGLSAKEAKKNIDNLLDAKVALQEFDNEYFELYRKKLILEGKTEEQVATIIGAKRKELYNKNADEYVRMLDQKHEADKTDLQKYLEIKGRYNQYDEDYFMNYRKLLEMQYSDSDEINIKMADEAIRVAHERADTEKNIVISTNDLIKTAVQGVADSIKSIWDGSTKTFQDVWHGALDIFVDVMAQMIIQAELTGAAISVTMAAATAGISLVVGMLSMALGGHGKSIKVEPVTVRLKKVFDDFVKDFKGAVGEFKEKLFPKKEEAEKTKSFIDASITWLKQIKESPLSSATVGIVSHVRESSLSPEFKKMLKDAGISWKTPTSDFIVNLTKKLSENLTSITSLIVERFNKIKDIVGDILDLYKRQGEFTKGMDKTILDVKRSLFSPEQTFTAQLGDIELLRTAVAGAVGENQLTLVGELKDAYLAAWGTSKDMFKDDASKLAEWQKFTVDGLEGLKATGKSAYDKLIDVNLDMLGLQRSGVDLQTQMTGYLSSLDTNIVSTLKAIQDIGTSGTATDNQLSLLTTTLASLFNIPLMAAGGIVTRPTLAMIGESGPEAVVPLSRMNQSGNVSVSIEGAMIMDEITLSKFARTIGSKIRNQQMRYV